MMVEGSGPPVSLASMRPRHKAAENAGSIKGEAF